MRLLRTTAALLALLPAARAARACGGGLVSVDSAVAADAQVVFLSVRDGRTDVVTQVVVPQAGQDWGVLIPVPGRPALDTAPIPGAALDALERLTRPSIEIDEDDGGLQCGCPLGGAALDGKSGGAPTVEPPVDIGPVTAVVIGADTGQPIVEWLTANGFTVPAAQRPLVDEYAGPGRFFGALRRNARPLDRRESIGVHFTLEGDQRALPLRFARLGAAARLSFLVFVAAPQPASPRLPFTALTIRDLDEKLLRADAYPAAVAAAVEARAGRAFVAEKVAPASTLTAPALEPLRPFLPAGHQLTRLTTVVGAERLTADAVLDGPLPGSIPDHRTVGALGGSGAPPTVAAALLLALFTRRSLRRRPRSA